ncbi:hypothetical protein [Brevibacillus reuszeri]|uniref:hypothetical protein n=1 Tax=Brevibacillus reuszeri TaxID=54915 RepID=UPI003D25DB0C
MNRQAVLDVLNSLKVIEKEGGSSPYCLVAFSQENRSKLNTVGVADETMLKYGDDESFCIWVLAFSEGFANEYRNGKLIQWGPIDDELRYRVLNGEGTPSDAERLLKELEGKIHPREHVRWFAGQMEAKLQENDHKGGWDNCDMDFLLSRLQGEVDELTAACVYGIDPTQVIREGADVANFAMMISDKVRKSLT